MKRKKFYDKPQMWIVKLFEQTQLMTESGVSATRENYGIAIEEEWE